MTLINLRDAVIVGKYSNQDEDTLIQKDILIPLNELFDINKLVDDQGREITPIMIETIERIDPAPESFIRPRTKEREDFLAVIGITAAEGGITHWATVSNYDWYDEEIDGGTKEPAEHGGGNVSYVVSCNEETADDEIEPTIVDLDVIERGWTRYLAAFKSNASPFVSRLRVANETNDDECTIIDSDVANAVIQWGVLGEHIYD